MKNKYNLFFFSLYFSSHLVIRHGQWPNPRWSLASALDPQSCMFSLWLQMMLLSCERLWTTLNSICECRQTVEHVWYRLVWPDQRIGTDISSSHCVQTISIVLVRAISQHTMLCLQSQYILYATVKIKEMLSKITSITCYNISGPFLTFEMHLWSFHSHVLQNSHHSY